MVWRRATYVSNPLNPPSGDFTRMFSRLQGVSLSQCGQLMSLFVIVVRFESSKFMLLKKIGDGNHLSQFKHFISIEVISLIVNLLSPKMTIQPIFILTERISKSLPNPVGSFLIPGRRLTHGIDIATGNGRAAKEKESRNQTDRYQKHGVL